MEERFQWIKILYSTSMQHDMPQSLIVFAVSFTPETPILGRSVEFIIFSLIFAFNYVYALIYNINYKNIFILKKIEFGHFRVQNFDPSLISSHTIKFALVIVRFNKNAET